MSLSIKNRQNLSRYEIGRLGEYSFYKHLDYMFINKKIKYFKWLNKTKESNKPYDFIVIHNNNHKKYLEVKTTKKNFENSIFFTHNELEFLYNSYHDYEIIRIYNKDHRLFMRHSINLDQIVKSKDIKNIYLNKMNQELNKFGLKTTNKIKVDLNLRINKEFFSPPIELKVN